MAKAAEGCRMRIKCGCLGFPVSVFRFPRFSLVSVFSPNPKGKVVF